MTRYTAPQRTPRKRRVLSRSTKILSLAAFLFMISLFAIVRPPAKAAAANPIYATFQYVDNAISAALSPIQSAIASLQTQQASQASQISNLQNSSSKSLKAYDANGQELGIVITYEEGTVGTLYSPTLSRFINLHISNHAIDGLFAPSDAYYQSTNCTGTPYIVTEQTDALNSLFVTDSQGFYIVPNSATPTTTLTSGSLSSWTLSDGTHHCDLHTETITQPTYALQQVNLPFTTPPAFPLQFKYQ